MQEAPTEAAHASKIQPVQASAPGSAVTLQRPAPPAVRLPGYDGPHDFGRMWQVAEHLSRASILPNHFLNSAANVFAVMTQARAANIPIFTALQHMNVIDGRVEESAELVRAMLLAAGFGFRVVSSTMTAATVEITRPGGQPQQVTFTMAQAQLMNLADKRNWKLTPDAMLVARATTRAASWFAPDVTMGLANLSHADLGDDVPDALEHLRPEDIDSPTIAARAILDKVGKAETGEAVRALGAQARDAGLLNMVLDGATVQTHLMEKLGQLEAVPVAELEATADELLPCGCEAAAVLADGTHQSGCAA